MIHWRWINDFEDQKKSNDINLWLYQNWQLNRTTVPCFGMGISLKFTWHQELTTHKSSRCLQNSMNFWDKKKQYTCQDVFMFSDSSCRIHDSRESRHLIRINIITGKIHSSSRHRKKKLVQEKIDKLINKRLKAFQLRQWTKCYCSLFKQNSGHFYHVLFAIFSIPKKTYFHLSLFSIQCERGKIWKIAKMKNSIKTRTDNCCLNDSWKSKKKLYELKRCEFHQTDISIKYCGYEESIINASLLHSACGQKVSAETNPISAQKVFNLVSTLHSLIKMLSSKLSPLHHKSSHA